MGNSLFSKSCVSDFHIYICLEFPNTLPEPWKKYILFKWNFSKVCFFDTLKSRQNGRHFPDDLFQRIPSNIWNQHQNAGRMLGEQKINTFFFSSQHSLIICINVTIFHSMCKCLLEIMIIFHRKAYKWLPISILDNWIAKMIQKTKWSKSYAWRTKKIFQTPCWHGWYPAKRALPAMLTHGR